MMKGERNVPSKHVRNPTVRLSCGQSHTSHMHSASIPALRLRHFNYENTIYHIFSDSADGRTYRSSYAVFFYQRLLCEMDLEWIIG